MAHSHIKIEGLIDKVKKNKVKQYFATHHTSELHDVYLNSNGGNYNDAIEIGHLIAEYPTRGIAKKAKSCGFLILQCCTERIAERNAEFLLHFPRFGDNQITFRHLRVFYTVLQVVSKRSGNSIKFLWELALSEATLSATQALQLRFVDKIL